MFRIKTISTISTITTKSLQNRDSLLGNTSKRNSNRSSRSNRNSSRNSKSLGKIIKRKQKRDVEQSITLGEVYLIVNLCSNEVVKRGLVEPDIFNPVRSEGEIEKVRYLINCLLRDNRAEFEDELELQSIHSIIVGIRMALRNCDSNIVSYKDYEEFVKHEREWQYDLKNESFNHFLSRLPRKNKGILIELFDLFAMAMENSHLNQMHPIRIIKSMSLYIFNESHIKNCKNFLFSYKIWLKYSNATIHLFLSYIRERSYLSETKLPERLNLLLQDYVERREQCFTTSCTSEDGKDIIFGEHILPDITMMNLDEANQIFKQINSIDFNNDIDIDIDNDNDSISVNTRLPNNKINFIRKSVGIFDSFPGIMDSITALKQRKSFDSFISTLDDPETAEEKWDELQDKRLNLLSEETLKLFLDYDDIVSIDINGGKKKRDINPRRNERLSISEPILPFSKVKCDESLDGNYDENEINSVILNDNEEDTWEIFSREGFRKSKNLNSEIDSTLSDIGDNLTRISFSEDESRVKKNRKISKFSSFLCFKCSTYLDEPEEDQEDRQIIIDNSLCNLQKNNSHVSIEIIDPLFPYIFVETNTEGQDELLDEWVIIEPSSLAHENEWIIIEDKDKKNLYQEKDFDNTKEIKLSNRISSLSSVYTPSILSSSQQFDCDDLTKPQEPYFERPATPTKRMVELQKDDDYYYQDYQERARALQLYQIQKQKFYSRQLYQDDYFNHEIHSPYGRRSPALSIQSSNMSDSSVILTYGNIIRGKELPYPITPINRQSSISRQSSFRQLGPIPINRETPTRFFQQPYNNNNNNNNLMECEIIENPHQSQKLQ